MEGINSRIHIDRAVMEGIVVDGLLFDITELEKNDVSEDETSTSIGLKQIRDQLSIA